MKEKKRKGFLNILIIICMVLVLALTINVLPAASAMTADSLQTFTDMPDNWAKEALEKAVANGLLLGDNGKIMPDSPLTRAQMATIIVRVFGAGQEGDISVYSDIKSSDWFAGSMAKALKMGVMQGYDGKMNPESNISREQAFAILARAMKVSPEEKLNKIFADAGSISDWAKGDVYALVNAGYIQGSGEKLNPQSNISRAEFAQIMYNIFKEYISTPGQYSQVAQGNIVVNVPGVSLKNLTVNGDLIVGDGVGDGDLKLDQVTIKGNLILRGGGINSIVIVGGSVEGKIIVGKVDGQIRVSIEGGADVETIFVDDGKDDVIIEGRVGTIDVRGDNINVIAKNADVKNAIISGNNSKIVLEEGSKIKEAAISGVSATILLDQGTSVDKIIISGKGANIEGKGDVKSVAVKSGGDNASIRTPNTEIKVDKGVIGTLAAGGVAVEGGISAKNNAAGNDASLSKPGTSGNKTSSSGSTDIKVSAISVSVKDGGATEITTDEGQLQMVADVQPANASNKAVTWSVDDSSIATINSDGLLTAKTNGTVKVTATAKDGSGKSGFVEITISNQRTLKSVSIGVKANSNPLLSKPVVGAELEIKDLEPTEAGATVTYQWQISDYLDEDFTNISEATEATYKVKPEDEGRDIRLLVTGTGEYKGTVDSDSMLILKIYTVTFDPQGGSDPSPETMKVVPPSTYKTYGTFPTVTRDDYTFHGWFTEETGGFEIEEGSWIDGELFTENKLTLYARWIKTDDVLLVGATGISGTGDDTYLNNDGTTGESTNYKVHYNSTSKTLTLKGYNGGSIEVLDKFGAETLNLVLEGDNKVNGSIKGNNDKTPEKGSSLKISGSETGKLEIEGSIRMYGTGEIEIESGTIDINNGQLYVYKGGITISGGEVTITGNLNTSAISLDDSDLTISVDAKVGINLENDYYDNLHTIRANNIYIKDRSKLSIKANAKQDSWGLYIQNVEGTLSIESGTTVNIETSTEQSYHEAQAIYFMKPGIGESKGKLIVNGVEIAIPTGPNYTHNPTTKIGKVTITGFVEPEVGGAPITVDKLKTTDVGYTIKSITWYALGTEFNGTFDIDLSKYYAVIKLEAKTGYEFLLETGTPPKPVIDLQTASDDWMVNMLDESTNKNLLIRIDATSGH